MAGGWDLTLATELAVDSGGAIEDIVALDDPCYLTYTDRCKTASNVESSAGLYYYAYGAPDYICAGAIGGVHQPGPHCDESE